ncbi:MAG TPA: 6-carboxytetrahydropterin synthase [Blastocatellia bacterium]
MFEIGIIDEFEAAHRLIGNFGPATRLHGHTYRVETRVWSRHIGSDGVFYDLGLLRADLRAVLAKMHYRDLGELPELSGTNTTVEQVARYIFTELEPPLRAAGLFALKVTVWESSFVFGAYYEEFEPTAQGANPANLASGG